MESYINIAICEDDEKQLLVNKHYVEQWATLRDKRVNILIYKNAESFLFNWNYEQHFDIVFLDIQMGQMSGMELAQYIRSRDEDIEIIFITGEDKYVFNGYKVRALDYLMKPIKQEEVCQCLDVWMNKNQKKESSYFLLKKGKEILKVSYDDIYYFISFDHYVDMHTTDEVITFKEKIGQVEQQLPQEQFCRCHRSYILNLKYIDTISKNEIVLDNEAKIPVSKSRVTKTHEAFMKYFRNHIK